MGVRWVGSEPSAPGKSRRTIAVVPSLALLRHSSRPSLPFVAEK